MVSITDKPMVKKVFASPIGKLILLADDTHLRHVAFADEWPKVKKGSNAILEQTCIELEEYFAKTRKTFTVPLAFEGTPFQSKVWTRLSGIPFGVTASYKEVAEAINHLSAYRAVGTANGKNPLAIIIPCHRVINEGGKLGGYGGGLHRKEYLLRLEQSLA